MIRRKTPSQDNPQDNRSKLVDAAIELNEQLGLEPKIDVTLSEEEIEESIKEAIRVLTPEDVFSDDTTAVLIRLGWGADNIIENDETEYEDDTYQEDRDEEESREEESKEEEEDEEKEEEEDEEEVKAEEETDAQNEHADKVEEKSKKRHVHTSRKKRKSYKGVTSEFPKELYKRPKKKGRKIDPNSWYAQLLTILLVGGTPREVTDKYNAVARELEFKTMGVDTVKYYVRKILKSEKYEAVRFDDDYIQIRVRD